VTTRSAAPTNSEGSEDAFSSAQVPYSLPSDRRQKVAKRGLVCHFYCPAHGSMLFRMRLQRNNAGTGNNSDGDNWMSEEAAALPCREGLRERNAPTPLVVSNKF